jgi:hypothetical protein
MSLALNNRNDKDIKGLTQLLIYSTAVRCLNWLKVELIFIDKNKPISRTLLGIVFLSAAIILPLIIWSLRLPIIESTYDGSAPQTLTTQPFEVFGFLITVLLGVTTWLRITALPRKKLEALIPVVLPLLVFLSLLYTQNEAFHAKSSDYLCYENAATSILAGSNPYQGTPSCYLYPPLLAQMLAFLHQVSIANPLFKLANEIDAWTAVDYFYQCGQFLQVILTYYLTLLLARNLGIKALPASLLVAALLLFNFSLIRTLTFSQINLWVLNCFLLSILLLQQYPFLAGLAVALGAHLKLYPLVLLLPWVVSRRWRAVLGVVSGLVAITIVQTGWMQDWTLWQQFLIYFGNVEKPTNYRNNGLWSLTFNLVKIPTRLLNENVVLNAVPIIVMGLSCLILAWFILRLVKREQIYSKLVKTSHPEREAWNNIFRFYGHASDAIALSLLISPSVWEHHYVIALPVALWAIATRRFDAPRLVGIGIFLIFCVPTFEIFPLSFHKLAGLLILVSVTSPSTVQDYFLSQRNYHSFLKARNKLTV